MIGKKIMTQIWGLLHGVILRLERMGMNINTKTIGGHTTWSNRGHCIIDFSLDKTTSLHALQLLLNLQAPMEILWFRTISTLSGRSEEVSQQWNIRIYLHKSRFSSVICCCLRDEEFHKTKEIIGGGTRKYWQADSWNKNQYSWLTSKLPIR